MRYILGPRNNYTGALGTSCSDSSGCAHLGWQSLDRGSYAGRSPVKGLGLGIAACGEPTR